MSKLGDELVRSMAQALAHAQGKRSGARMHNVMISPEEIQKARKSLEAFPRRVCECVRC
jgi:hypothetical protein